MNGKLKRLLSSLWEWGKAGVVAVIAAILINAFVLQAFQVKGESMMPTLQHKDSTFALKLQTMYDYGDIVIVDSRSRDRQWSDPIFEQPLVAKLLGGESEYLWVKRVVGKEGDLLEFKGSSMFRNGDLLEEPYVLEPMVPSDTRVVVPPGHVFVMGDNRNNSKDSRVIGSLPLSNVIGKVIYKY